MKNQEQALGKLRNIYNYKKRQAEQAIAKQLQEVEKCVAELAEIEVLVASLEATLQANSAYRGREEVNSDARKMVVALKYKAQIDYDHERQSFYLGMADEDLQEQKLQLQYKKNMLSSIEAKIKVVDKELKKLNHARSTVEELSLEESFELIYSSRVRQYV